MKKHQVTFLFFHYGKIPSYLCHAIEHVKVFNPDAEIHLITDSIKKTSRLNRLNIVISEIQNYQSEQLMQFKNSYQHISCFNEKYERFVLERWFVMEIVRKQRPDRLYVTLDSDVAVFGTVDTLINKLPEHPIVLTNRNPGFNFIKGDISEFLDFINGYYRDEDKLSKVTTKFKSQENPNDLFSFGEMQLLFEYLELNRGMQIHHVDKNHGFIDCNLHMPQEFEHLQLRRRPRKKVFWQLEGGRAIPYFKQGDELVRAFLLHFQGPAKRVFHRFNSIDGPTTPFQIWWWNQIFQKRWLADLM